MLKILQQKTDAYQLSKALILNDLAEFNAKPELEIYADDVSNVLTDLLLAVLMKMLFII